METNGITPSRYMEEKNCQLSILNPAKISIRNQGKKKKRFSDEEKLRKIHQQKTCSKRNVEGGSLAVPEMITKRKLGLGRKEEQQKWSR